MVKVELQNKNRLPSRLDMQLKVVRVFPDRNLDTSKLTVSCDPAPPLLRLAQAGSGLAQLRLRSAHPPHQKLSTFKEGSEGGPPLPR